ncbi:MAG: GNAT family N-acetyltransferase [Actinomycetota bacterium]|nr:GNAT family N-acetyltransferase [Actinomycetota bacterium]
MSTRVGDALLTTHLEAYLGAWPPSGRVEVVGWPGRVEAGWDGSIALAVVVRSPEGTVISVPPDLAPRAARLSGSVCSESFRDDVAQAVGAPGRASPWLALRWSTEPAPLPDLGRWVEPDDPALPDWLRVFPSRVLVARDEDGRYLAGVGIKSHTRWGKELAVGTEEEARGRGFARRLVAQAARAVLEDGAMPLYVHHPGNAASARVAEAAGFPDLGWRQVVVFAP